MKIKFHAFNRVFVTVFDWKKQKDEIYGYDNKVYGLGYIVTIDYDRLELDWVIAEALELQELYGLSHFYIFETNKGYHAVCFDKVPLTTFVSILKNSSCDPNYLDIPLKFGKLNWVLRFSEKDGKRPKFVKVVLSTRCNYKKSKAHIDTLCKFYPEIEEIISRENEDNSTKIGLANYRI